MSRYIFQPIPRPAPGLGLPNLEGEVLKIHPPGPLASALQAALTERSVSSEVVVTLEEDTGMCVLLTGLAQLEDRAQAIALNRTVFEQVRALAKHQSEHGGALILTQDTGGDFGRTGAGVRAWSAGLSALARTAAHEWPESVVRLIDVVAEDRAPEDVARALADELTLGGTAPSVGLTQAGERYVMEAKATSVEPASSPPLQEGDLVMVSGGGKGVTAHTLLTLAEHVPLRFVLLGRSELQEEPRYLKSADDLASVRSALVAHHRSAGTLPTPAALEREVRQIMGRREIQHTLKELQRRGSHAHYRAIDVTDTQGLSVLVEEVTAQFGPLKGIIHGAGVLADRRIEDKTDVQFERVFHTKVGGLAALLDATREQPLSALLLFSSVAAAAGNTGQADYAMANEVLERVADQERASRGDACRVRALGWGPWAGGMVTPELARAFESRGVELIDLDAGAHAMWLELLDSESPASVVLGASADAGALVGATGPRSVRGAVCVSRSQTPFLVHHQISGAPVVPVALVLEWMTRIAQACRPTLTLQKITDLQVLRPIRLHDFEAGTWLQLEATETANGQGSTLACILAGPDGAPLYRATASLEASPFSGPKNMPQTSGLKAFPERPIYDGEVLFHGQDFQVIRSLEGIAPDGLEATLEAMKSTSWPGGPWRTDAASLDGALQLALLWTQEQLGFASLPMSIRSFECYDLSPTESFKAVLRGASNGAHGATVDVMLFDMSGRPRLALKGIGLIRRPDTSRDAQAPL